MQPNRRGPRRLSRSKPMETTPIPVRSGSHEPRTKGRTWPTGDRERRSSGDDEVQKILDTVLGLSVTPTTVGWVLAEGHGADGTILDHHELAATRRCRCACRERRRASGRRSNAGERGGGRKRSPFARHRGDLERRSVRQAALLLEALTDAGFDNVVPVRMARGRRDPGDGHRARHRLRADRRLHSRA